MRTLSLPSRSGGLKRRLPGLGAILLGAVLLQPGALSAADPIEAGFSVPRFERIEAPRHVGHLRIGASSGNDNGRPELCLELSPWQPIAFEACGTGSGILHRDPTPELAHFRARWRAGAWRVGQAWIEPQLGAGLAELQVGVDAPGFRFGAPGEDAVEIAGPEAMAALRALWPLGGGFELLADLSLGMAWLPGAERLALPSNRWQPFAALGIGVGW